MLVHFNIIQPSNQPHKDARLENLERLHKLASPSSSSWLDGGNDPSTPSSTIDASDFPAFVEALNDQLAQLWKDDKRVQVVRLTIQVAKMLGDPSNAGLVYYPAMFFQLTDIISYLGQLVYDRLGSLL